MEVILKKDVDKLGAKDDLVAVKPGFARNYLIPQGMATLATESAKKVREENLRQRAHKIAKIKDEAQAAANKLKGAILKIGAKVGESGKIFGSVTNIQVAEALKNAGHEIDRKNITINDEPIKEIGTYKADVKFHREVVETIEFEVVGE